MSQSERESFLENGLHCLSYQRSFFKAMCFITVVVRPNNTSNEQQIHNCKISIFYISFLFLFFFLFNKCHLCQLPRDSAFLISVSEITPSALGISLWVDDLFFLLLALLYGMLGQDQCQSQAGKQSPDVGTQTGRVILWQAPGFAQATVSWFRILFR